MAVTFRRSPQTLIEEIKQSGYRIAEITSDIGDPKRSLQISLQNGVVVNWDRDSYSVWAHGPQPLSEKIETYLAARHSQGKSQKTTSRFFIWAMLILLAGLLFALARKNGGDLLPSSQPSAAATPAASTPASEQPAP